MQSRFEIRPVVLILFVLAFAFGSIACGSPSEKSTTTGNPTNMSAAPAGSASPAGSSSAMPGDNSGNQGGAMTSSPNAESAPYDLQFIDTMSAHHRSAIEMAKLAETKAQHAELKAFAKKIVDDQEKEIAQMKSWRDGWYGGKSQALNLELPGMHSMKGTDMGGLNAATGTAFDLMFLRMMTQHHQGAVTMAKEALMKAGHSEINQLARRISDAQQQEIAQMSRWSKAWGGAK